MMNDSMAMVGSPEWRAARVRALERKNKRRAREGMAPLAYDPRTEVMEAFRERDPRVPVSFTQASYSKRAGNKRSPERVIPGLVNHVDMERALFALPDDQRRCFMLVVYHGRTTQQLAISKDVEEESIRRLLERACDTLIESLYEDWRDAA